MKAEIFKKYGFDECLGCDVFIQKMNYLNSVLEINAFCMKDPTNKEGIKKKLKIFFDSPYLYRVYDEGSYLVSSPEITISESEFEVGGFLYYVEQSELIASLRLEKLKGVDFDKMNHYYIASENELIDVLHFGKPRIELIKG